MTHKHSCLECSQASRIEDGFLTDLPFVVIARHIHTGKVTDCAQFETLEKAQSYARDMKRRCTSHESFAVVARGKNQELTNDRRQ